jgi:hypothetical protein
VDGAGTSVGMRGIEGAFGEESEEGVQRGGLWRLTLADDVARLGWR